MKAKSDALRGSKRAAAAEKERGGTPSRMPHAERRAQILATASEFFADYGLTAQTRRLAEECGISQRLLYRFFPTKEDLLAEVYREEILGAFKGVWFAELGDRSRSVEERLTVFYTDYLRNTLSRKWLRLFMYASLSESAMAPDYISSIITQLLELIMSEAAHERGVILPDDKPALHEMGWTLHGAISHYAIRRHLYRASHTLPEERVVEMHVRMFLAGFDAMLAPYIAAD
ncbi:TetR/AcrR family transcriptional regulator [Acidimangrovimonas pyrenivorans]|uniref:TetR/AcrR family transcriptional regulator n=1 Tax=Acidimangrovimonas pyrenivorans TaxID=2030798 RepID=A0ABV7AIM5_9RHOB